MDDVSAQAHIECALEEGVRLFDTAHSYARGKSEKFYGKYLCPKYRAQVFILTKSTAKTAEKIEQEISLSLRRMNTDYVDLFFFHALRNAEDVDERQASGVFDKVREFQAKGIVRHIGYSCHTHTSAALHLLDKIRDDDFICCGMTPVNSVDAAAAGNSFTTQVIPQMVSRGHAHLAMKTLAGGALVGGKRVKEPPKRFPIPAAISMEENFLFVLSQPVTAWVSGMESPQHVKQNARIARNFTRLTDHQKAQIVAKVAEYHADPRMEDYKKAL
jgi:predicted aldo/keto reductase-like oxidoreductase